MTFSDLRVHRARRPPTHIYYPNIRNTTCPDEPRRLLSGGRALPCSAIHPTLTMCLLLTGALRNSVTIPLSRIQIARSRFRPRVRPPTVTFHPPCRVLPLSAHLHPAATSGGTTVLSLLSRQTIQH